MAVSIAYVEMVIPLTEPFVWVGDSSVKIIKRFCYFNILAHFCEILTATLYQHGFSVRVSKQVVLNRK